MAASPQQGAASDGVWDKHAYHILAGAAVGIIVLGTVIYHHLEDWSWVDSLYFSVVAGTTVGFGDLAPTSDASKLFTIVFIVAALSIIGTFLNVRFRTRGVVAARIDHVDAKDED